MISLQASSAQRWIECPGSVHLEQSTVKEYLWRPQLDSATLGRLIHKVGEDGLKAYKETGMNPAMSKIIPDKKDENYERIKATAEYYIKAVSRYHKKMTKRGKVDFLIEEKYEQPGPYRFVARADCIMTTYTDAEIFLDVFDLKTGNFDYSESAAYQLRFTALLFAMLNIKEKNIPIEVTLHVIQPWFWMNDEQHTIQRFVLGTVGDAVEELSDYIKMVSNGQDKLNNGSWCSFCPCLLVCPKVKGVKDLMAAAVHQSVENMKTETIEDLYLMKSFIEQWFKAAEAYLLSELEKGKALNKFSIGQKYGHRRWMDEEETKEKLKYLGEKLFDVKLKTPAQVEKIAGKENIRGLYHTPTFNAIVKKESGFSPVDSE